MQQSFLLTIKRLVVAIGAVMLLARVCQLRVLAEDAQSEKVDAIVSLVAEINYFYLDPRAAEFMNIFYTRDSYENLRATIDQAQEIMIANWETDLDDNSLTELYQLLRSAVGGLRPLFIRRGEATARSQELNFRVQPETGTQVFHTLTYGTPFEILEEVSGGVVIGDDLSRNYRWFRIRHNDQSGYVHARYVRDLPVSEERIKLLADIARQELWIQSMLDGWQIDFSPNTRQELAEILNSAHALKSGNWQFDFSYYELNQILQSLSYGHLNLVTLFRYNLVNNIIELKGEIKSNIQGTGSSRMEEYTETSWENMHAALTSAQELLINEWQYNLDDDELKLIYELLLSGLNGLEQIPQPELAEYENNQVDSLVDSEFNLERIIILGALALAGLIGIIIIIKVIKSIYYR